MESPLIRNDHLGVATLTLNRPEQRNALCMSLMEALIANFDDVARDDRVRVIIIRGNGPAFCAGHDLKEMRCDPSHPAQAKTFETCARMMMAIVNLPQPVVAQVHGVATAAGCQLVAACDLAVAADTARFATPGVNIGLFCSTPGVALSRNVGRKQAMEMLLTGEMIDAPTARAFGLVNRVVPEVELENAAMALATKIAAKSFVALRTGKKAFYRQIEVGLEAAYEYTSAVMVRNMLEDDAAEGIDAFLEKRAPRWSGEGV